MSEHSDSFKTKASNEAYRDGHKRIFGEKKSCDAGKYILVDGELIPEDEYKQQPKECGVSIISDISEGVSPITGEVISGRRAMREHCREHDVYYSGRRF